MAGRSVALLFNRMWVGGVLLVLHAGCTVGPDHRAPEAAVPEAWIGAGRPPTTQPLSVTTQQRVELTAWWKHFDDPTLNSLIERAIEGNLDLQQAVSRIRQARAQRRIVAADRLPNVNVGADYRRSWSGDGRGNSPSDASDLFQLGLDASWELDVFGGIRRRVEAAEADVQFAIEDSRDVLVTLVSEVALNYLDLRGLQRQIAIANGNLAAQRRSGELTRKRFAGGFIGSLDVANADALVARTESQIPALESAVRQTIFNLSLLIGREPGALLEELSVPAPIPAVPPEVPIGLPSELLRRRPDIRRAEAQIAGATARIGAATADLFPRFSLTGSLGIQGERVGEVGNFNNRFWSIGPGVSWPLFDAGRIRANIELESAQEEQSLLAYRSIVLLALRDVESALVAYGKEQQRRQSILVEVAANRRAVEVATELYTLGETDFLNVLSAQRSLLSSEDALVQSDRTIAANLVALYKALGGGWEIGGR